MFYEDITIRDKARKTFCNQINNVITACYGEELCITHNCLTENNEVVRKQDTVQNMFQEQNLSTFQRAHHKEICTEIQGGLMSCSDCGKIISTSDIINSCLKRWRDIVIPSNRIQNNRPDTIVPLSIERLDMAAYTFTYHMENGCALEKRLFWGELHARELLLKYKFEEHSACHKASCFKKGCEYRFLFPFMSNTSTYIHEDKGVQNENEIFWYSLDGSTREMIPFIVLPRRPMGCQYINPHNSPILNVFNFNTNIQIGDVSQVFYSTSYTSKSTQEEDSEQQLRIGHAIIKRMKKLLEESSSTESSNDACNQATLELNFCEGLCRVLS